MICGVRLLEVKTIRREEKFVVLLFEDLLGGVDHEGLKTDGAMVKERRIVTFDHEVGQAWDEPHDLLLLRTIRDMFDHLSDYIHEPLPS